LSQVLRNGNSENVSNGSSGNSSNGSSGNSSNGSSGNSSNGSLESLSNKSFYKLQKIFSEDLAWETPIVKQFILIYWIKLTIQEKEGNFITTRDIYEQYKKNCNALNEKVILTKASFYRLIWNSLLTAKIMYVKSQENGQKGIRGIQFKNIENN
jgi:Cdc6-like AAA superfamily ATPase